MAFVIARGDGRYEIRESVSTPAGPRGRTLATFRVLDEAVLDRAQARATRPFDRHRVAEQAQARGAPAAGPRASLLARELLGELRRGSRLAPALARALRGELPVARGANPDSLPPMLEWLGSTPERRGHALRDLLRVATRIPATGARRQGLRFPPIRSVDTAA